MPNFFSSAKSYKDKLNEIEGKPPVDPQSKYPNKFSENLYRTGSPEGLPTEEEQQMERDREGSLRGASLIGNEDAQARTTAEIAAQNTMHAFTNNIQDPTPAEGSWAPELVHEGIIDKLQTSVQYGIGEWMGRWGDVFQAAGHVIPGLDIYEGSMLSRWMQEKGDEISKANITYIPEEVLDPEFKFSTFANPEFWAVHGGRFVPQIIEILATIGAAKVATTAATKGAQALLKGQMARTGKTAHQLGARTTTESVYKGAKGIQEVTKGRGLTGKIFTDRGTTGMFKGFVGAATGGGITNLHVSLANAGEIYNTYSEVMDEENNPVFTDQELGEMAGAAFTNNMWYLGMDMISWGMTFGKGFGLRDPLMRGAAQIKKGANSVELLKKTGAMFGRVTRPLERAAKSRAAHLGVRMGREGVEETFQESWEEWSKAKAYFDKVGSLEGYLGLPEGSDYGEMGVGDFMDFYRSKDSEAIRTISFGLGALMGGVFNVNLLINKQADEAHKMYMRSENLKTVYESGTKGWENKDMFIKQQMAELVYEGKDEAFADFIKDKLESNQITDEEFESYAQLFDQMKAVKNDIDHLNIKGKKALMHNIAEQFHVEGDIEKFESESMRRVEILQNTLEGPDLEKALKREEKLLREQMAPMYQKLEQLKNNQSKLLQNEPADITDFDVKKDIYGNDHFVDKRFHEDPVKKDEAENAEVKDQQEGEIDKDDQPHDPSKAKPKKSVKDILDSVMGKIFGKKDTDPKSNKETDEDSEIKEDSEPESSKKEESEAKPKPEDTPVENENIVDNDKSRNLTKDVVSDFEAEGKIPSGVLDRIAEKIADNKKLTKKEQEIYEAFKQDVDERAEIYDDTAEAEFETVSDEDVKAESRKSKDPDAKKSKIERMAEYEKKAARRKRKGKTIQQEKEEAVNKLAEQDPEAKKRMDEEAKVNQEQEALKEEFAQATNEADANPETETEAKSDKTEQTKEENVKEKTEKDNPIKKRINKWIDNMTSKAKDSKRKVGDALTGNDPYDFRRSAERRTINHRLAKMFPDVAPRVQDIDNLVDSVGTRVLGFTLAGAIYVDADNWHQGGILHHETAHILYDLMKDTPQVKKLIELGMKDKELMDFIKIHYDGDILYDAGDGQYVYKKSLFKGVSKDGKTVDMYHVLSQEQKQKVIDDYIKKGMIQEIPLSEQPIIAEEIFAFMVQKIAAPRFDKTLGAKISPDTEQKRKNLAKGFWQNVKERAQKDPFYDEKQFLRELSPDERTEFTSTRDYIIEQLNKGIAGKDLSPRGKSSAMQSTRDAKLKAALHVETMIEKNIDEHINSKFVMDKDILENIDELMEAAEMMEESPFYNMERLQYIDKASEIVKDFASSYNRVLQKRFFKTHQDTPTNWSKLPTFSADSLLIKLNQLVNASDSSIEFIQGIMDSDIVELNEFNDFLNHVRDDKEMFLNTYFWLLKNQQEVNSIKLNVNKDGNFSVQDNLNSGEYATGQNILNRAISNVTAFHQAKKPANKIPEHKTRRFAQFKESAQKIRNNEATSYDYHVILDFFNDGSIDTLSMLKDNQIIINGKSFNARNVIKTFLESNQGMADNNINQYEKSGNTFKSTGIKPGVTAFINGIVATNRKYSANKMILNTEGNPENTRIVKNFLLREFDGIRNDARNMSFPQFINKYAHVSQFIGEGSQSNRLLKFMYDKINSGGDININQYHGTENAISKESSVLKSSNDTEHSIVEFLSYLSSDKNNSYLMEMNRFAESPRAFMFEAPKLRLNELGQFKDGEFVFNTKSKPHLKTAFEIYKRLNPKGMKDFSLKDFQNVLQKEINEEYQFFEDNYQVFEKMNKTKDLFTEKGKLTPEGKNKVAEYVVNNTLNGIYFNEVFFPSIDLTSRDKRAKLAMSPGFAFGSHVKVENIPYVDEFSNYETDGVMKQDVETDAAFYMLESDAELIRRMGGHAFPIGKAIKILNTGVEHSNQKFAHKNIYDKGYATILNDALVAKHPKLKGLYEMMKKRRKKYEAIHGPVSKNLLNGQPTHIIMAVPDSANKSGNWPNALVKNEGGVKVPTEYGQAFTLDNYNTMDHKRQNQILTNWYYQKNEFVGLSGENFVVQQVMDKERDTANLSVQLVRALLSNANITGNLDKVESLQRLVTESQRENLQSYVDIIQKGDAAELKSLIYDLVNVDRADANHKFSIMDGLSVSTPNLRILAANTLTNAIRKKGNKLLTPGSIAQQKPALYEKQYATNGTKKLAYYGTDSNGRTTKGEAIAPKFMEGKVIGRTYYTMDKFKPARNQSYEANLNTMENMVRQAAQKRGVGYHKLFDDSGKQIGFYVEGDTIMATRIPAHGLQTTGVFEVIDFDTTGASNVEVPSEFGLRSSGGDFDGDQLFIQHKKRNPRTGQHENSKWNQFMDGFVDHFLSPEMAKEIRLGIDYKAEADAAVKAIENRFGKKEEVRLNYSPAGRRKSFRDTMVSKGNIGVAANLHTLLGMLSAYEVPLSTDINIDGNIKRTFKDSDNTSRTIDSAKIFNIILDNSKDPYADKIGITEHTVSQVMILRNLGYDLTQIGILMNSKAVQNWNKVMSNRESIFTPKMSVAEIGNKVREMSKLPKKGPQDKINLRVSTKGDVNSEMNTSNIIDLMVYLESVNNQMSSISGMMSGHNKLETNPFNIMNDIKSFDSATDVNSQMNPLKISEDFRNNPIVKNYAEVAKINLEAQQMLDPVFRDDAISIFQKISNTSMRNFSKKEINRLHNDIELHYTSKLLGLNAIDKVTMKSVMEGNNSVYVKLDNHLNELAGSILVEGTTGNVFDSTVSEMNNSLLFSKAIKYNLHGKNKFLSLSPDFFNQTMDETLRQRILKEFEALPSDLKNAIVLYDLVKYGWKGPQSLFPLFDPAFKDSVSQSSDLDLMSRNEKLLSSQERAQLEKALLSKNSEMLITEYKNPFIKQADGRFKLNEKIGKKLYEHIMNGNPAVFVYKEAKTGKEFLVNFKGFPAERKGQIQRMKASDRRIAVETTAHDFTEVTFIDPKNDYNIDLTTIKNENDGDYIFGFKDDGFSGMSFNEVDKKFLLSREDLEAQARFMRDDYYNYTGFLDRGQFTNYMQFPKGITDAEIDLAYNIYLEKRNRAEKVYESEINESTVNDMSMDNLRKNFFKYAEDDQLANAVLLRPIIHEIQSRHTQDQMKLTGKNQDGKDITALKTWFMANNVPSNHPHVQGMVRKIEQEYKSYLKERNRMISDINKATDALYQESYGFRIHQGSIVEKIRAMFHTLMNNRELVYDNLYGNLVEIEYIDTPEGQRKNFKYKSEAEIKKLHSEGTVTDAQLNFYETTRKYSKELEPYNVQQGKGRKDYIPHTAPGMMETFSRRGLLGVMVNSRTLDHGIQDVELTYKNPETGQTLKAKFSDFHNMYNAASAAGKQDLGKSVDYYNLKRKAIKFYKKGINEDGTPIKHSKITVAHSLNDQMMNRFENQRSVKAEDFPSMDLNKAFVDYIDTSLFLNGNSQFEGMKNLIPLVDGVLESADRANNPNMTKYVDKVWKKYFLGKKRQKTIPNITPLEAVGIESDKIVDYITRSSLIYWLGYQGLALGGGLYATGNILVGKYHNIKNEGTGAWKNGENRFWFGASGKFDITNPFKGVRESQAILKRTGFLDINVYDDISVQSKTSFEKMLSNFALMPMIYSEKWIQGAHFLGLLSQDQWRTLAEGGTLDPNDMAKLENTVKNSHGKGYQATDQRMIQMFSWGRAMMQFSRYIPTMFYDRFAKEDINIYGEKHMGSYTALYKTIQRAVTGEMSPTEFKSYRENLDPAERSRLDSGLMGLGLMSAVMAINVFSPNHMTEGIIKDANTTINFDRLAFKTMSPAPLSFMQRMNPF